MLRIDRLCVGSCSCAAINRRASMDVHGMAWYDMVWHGRCLWSTWHGMVWYGMTCMQHVGHIHHKRTTDVLSSIPSMMRCMFGDPMGASLSRAILAPAASRMRLERRMLLCLWYSSLAWDTCTHTHAHVSVASMRPWCIQHAPIVTPHEC